MKIEIIENTINNGCDCWGRSELETVYYVLKDNKRIASFNYNPTNFLKELGIELQNGDSVHY